MADVDWIPFDYKSPPADDIYWLALSYPETWHDVGNDGRDIGGHTGKTLRRAGLYEVFTFETGFVDIRQVDEKFGRPPQGAIATHYAHVRPPALPPD